MLNRLMLWACGLAIAILLAWLLWSQLVAGAVSEDRLERAVQATERAEDARREAVKGDAKAEGVAARHEAVLRPKVQALSKKEQEVRNAETPDARRAAELERDRLFLDAVRAANAAIESAE